MGWRQYETFKIDDQVTNTVDLFGDDGFFEEGSKLVINEAFGDNRFSVCDHEGHCVRDVTGRFLRKFNETSSPCLLCTTNKISCYECFKFYHWQERQKQE